MEAVKSKVQAGWVIEIDAHQAGMTPRRGEILEVLGEPRREHYRVRWEDGRESIHYAGNDAHVAPPPR
jgi:secreted PhoX family phosphatase